MKAEVELKRLRVSPTLFIPLAFVAGLIFYKWNAARLTIQKVWSSGGMTTRTDVVAFGGATTVWTAFERTVNYFAAIWPALVFGILISAAVRAFLPDEWFAERLRGKTLRDQIASGVAGAPLMLCSCCVASVFTTVYERSSRLGPSLAMMLASPALNPAALLLTFLLFAPKVAAGRLLMAVPAVLLSGVAIERLFPKCSGPALARKPAEQLTFGRSLIDIVIRTIPALVLGVICSMLLIEYVPASLLSSSPFRSLAVILTATIAVPIALPTFFEIPLALGLLAAGAPAGAAVALLFAGPVINLPSLFALAKSTNWKIAATLAVMIWCIAVFGGLLL